jgi:hypothetical protein
LGLASTPTSIGPAVLALCARLRPGGPLPVYLKVDPDPDCDSVACFGNVARKVDRDGGRLQNGWAIWIWPRVYIEAEHHAVYEPYVGGPWRDMTPGEAGVRRRLFLADDAATFDTSARRDNVRVALADDPLVTEMFACMDIRTKVWRSGAALNRATGMTAFAELQAAELAQHFVQVELAKKYLRPNDPCFCGRSRRFGACHGRRPHAMR